MRTYIIGFVLTLIGACAGSTLAISLYTPSQPQEAPQPQEVHHYSGEVTVFPRTDLGGQEFYTVGNGLICDNIVLENGEVALHEHSYLATYTKYTKQSGFIFAKTCHLGNLSAGDPA